MFFFVLYITYQKSVLFREFVYKLAFISLCLFIPRELRHSISRTCTTWTCTTYWNSWKWKGLLSINVSICNLTLDVTTSFEPPLEKVGFVISLFIFLVNLFRMYLLHDWHLDSFSYKKHGPQKSYVCEQSTSFCVLRKLRISFE